MKTRNLILNFYWFTDAFPIMLRSMVSHRLLEKGDPSYVWLWWHIWNNWTKNQKTCATFGSDPSFGRGRKQANIGWLFFFLSSRLRCLVVVFSAFFCVVWLSLSFYVENILTSYFGVWTLFFFAPLFVCLPAGCVMIGLVMTSHVLP